KKERLDLQYEATRTILKVVDGKTVEEKWTFHKAVRLESGKPASCGFSGKTVLATRGGDGSWSFRYDGGDAIEGEDVTSIRQMLDRGSGQKLGGMSTIRMFVPKTPVGIGESWKPDMKAVIAELMKEGSQVRFDEEASGGALTLTSVEKRGAVEFARVEGTVELAVVALSGMGFEKPIPMKLTVDLNLCSGGALPDGRMDLKVEMKGTAEPDVGGGPSGIILKIDADVESRRIVKTAGKGEER
ncbi:MAG: hypothetical protein ACYTAF_02575, partial [Planctomycetota bacterium]